MFSLLLSLHSMVAAQLFGMEPRRCLRMSMERAMTPLMTLGRRHRAKIGSKKYGVEWELH